LSTNNQKPAIKQFSPLYWNVWNRVSDPVGLAYTRLHRRTRDIHRLAVQPQPQSNFIGGTVTFSVTAVSALPATNQWFKNNNPLTGKTNSSLTLTNVQAGDVANYRVVVGNNNGTTNSVTVAFTLLTAGNLLQWIDTGNSGVWDLATSANWRNLGNNQQVVFSNNDQVLFDDTVGVPTSVSVSGTVSPSVMTVDSSANSFTINGSLTLPGFFPPANPINNVVFPGTALQNWTAANAPALNFFTNNGTVFIPNEAHFGDDRPPYSAFVNNGFLQAGSVSVDSAYVENTGTLLAFTGPLSVHSDLSVLHNGVSASSQSFNQFSGGSVVFSNYQVFAGDALDGEGVLLQPLDLAPQRLNACEVLGVRFLHLAQTDELALNVELAAVAEERGGGAA